MAVLSILLLGACTRAVASPIPLATPPIPAPASAEGTTGHTGISPAGIPPGGIPPGGLPSHGTDGTRAAGVSLPRAPDAVGMTTAQLREAARRGRFAVRVIAFEEGGSVTSQDPVPGAVLPAGGYLVVWLGTPTEPEPVAQATVAAPVVVASPGAVAGPGVVARTGAVADAGKPVAIAAPAEDLAEPATELPEPPTTVVLDRTRSRTFRDFERAAPYPSIRTLAPAEPGLVLTGRASWYGTELAGSPVACGGAFDPAAATLAARELRCGTRVRVTALNGEATEAIVTDWGPATWTGKRFDLSMAVFAELASLSRGWIDVEVEVIASAP